MLPSLAGTIGLEAGSAGEVIVPREAEGRMKGEPLFGLDQSPI